MTLARLVMLGTAGLIAPLASGCDMVIARMTNDAISVEVQPGAALFELLDEIPAGQALVATPFIGSQRGGLLLASVVAVCRNGERLQVETAITETNTFEDVGGSPYAIAEAHGWTELTPSTDLQTVRGRANGLFLFDEDEPPFAYARIDQVADQGCDEASVLKSGGEYGLVGGEGVATTAPVPLHIERGLWANAVGTGGCAEPNLIDLADGLTLDETDTRDGGPDEEANDAVDLADSGP